MNNEVKQFFDNTTEDEVNKLIKEMVIAAKDGKSSLYYYPSTIALRKSVKKALETKGYWAKDTEEQDSWCSPQQAEESAKKGKRFCYHVYNSLDGNSMERCYRKGLQIWWVRPSFWEYYF